MQLLKAVPDFTQLFSAWLFILVWLPAYLSGLSLLVLWFLKEKRVTVSCNLIFWTISLCFSGLDVLQFLVCTFMLVLTYVAERSPRVQELKRQ